MEFSLSTTQREIQNSAQRVALDLLRPAWKGLDTRHEFPTELLKEMAGRGLMGINVLEAFGGLEAGVIAYSAAVQKIAWGDPAVAVTMCVNNMVAEVLQEFGNSRHKGFIPSLLSGQESSGAFCLSEAGSGSDAAGMQTNAQRVEGGFLLNGSKAWITSGEHAGAYLVWAQVDTGGKKSITVFFVEKETPGISFGLPEQKMGQHASNTVVVSFDDVKVPEDAVLGNLGEGFQVAMMALDGGRIGIASQSIGIADAMISEADAYGVEPGDYWRGRVEAARMLVWRAAFLKERKQPFTHEASMAKLYASETACALGDGLIQMAGAQILSGETLFAKLIRDARVTRIYEGTSEVQRIVIARELDRRAS